jgi:hypothetical protein
LARVKAGEGEDVFEKAFEEGDELFSTEFTAPQGEGRTSGITNALPVCRALTGNVLANG